MRERTGGPEHLPDALIPIGVNQGWARLIRETDELKR